MDPLIFIFILLGGFIAAHWIENIGSFIASEIRERRRLAPSERQRLLELEEAEVDRKLKE